MRPLKQALAILGTVVVIAVIAALVTPKTAHALVATFVQVVNTPSQPVPTWSTDNDGRSVVRLYYFENMAAGAIFNASGGGSPMIDASTTTAYTVPAGKRLVIESESAFAYPPDGEQVSAYFLNGHTYTAIPMIAQAPNVFENAIAVRDYVEPGGQYVVSMFRTAGTDAMFWSAYVVGHLVDCTNGGGC
jgi:hypothetical protein